MIGHFIPRTGKGGFVVVLPLITSIILFVLFDAIHLSDRYIAPLCFLLPSFIIWFFDGGPKALQNGFKGDTPKSRHTLFWIEIKYWAILLGIIGCVLLANAINGK